MAPVWKHLDCMGWRVTSLFVKRLFFYIKEAVIVTGFLSTAQTGTNRAQTNDTSFVRFRRTGVESDVTASENNLVIYTEGK